LLLEPEQTLFVTGLDQFADQGGGGDEANAMPALTCGQAQRQGDVRLAGAAVAEQQDVFPAGRYRTNDYSVPTQYGHRQVLVKAYVHRIVIVAGSEIIAEHQRSYEREAAIYDPLHYLVLLEHKSRALDQAAPLAGWQLPECFAQLRRLLEARLRKHAGREYIQVLRLLETFALEEVTHAIEDALRICTISFDAVRHLVLCRIERRPPRLDMANWPHLPLAQVRTTQAADYMSLLSMPTAEPPTLEATL
jgi:hypothetical protein